MTSSQKTIWDRIKAVGVWIKARYEACVSPIVHVLTWGLIFVLVAVMFSDYVSGRLECLLDTDSKKETLTFIGGGIGGLILLLGLILNDKTSINKHTDAQTEAAKAHDNARFKAAIDHLGSEHPRVRIASFEEFNSLAQNSDGRREEIFNILCSHLRQITTNAAYGENERPTEEVQILLDVLFKSTGRFAFEIPKANLQRVNLRGANLVEAYLQEANLSHANLRGADLRKAHLQKANLSNANFRSSDLRNSELWSAILRYTNLQSAYIGGAQLYGAVIEYSKLQDIDAVSVQLQGSEIVHCNLSNANLKDADLRDANLWYSLFYATVLQNCNLQGADLMEAEFQGAYLRSLKLQGAQFSKNKMGGVTTRPVTRTRYMDVRINNRAGEDGNIDDVIYFGGINQDDVDKIANLVTEHHSTESNRPFGKEGRANEHQYRMQKHICQKERTWVELLPKEREIAKKNILLDSYTKKEAEPWIEDYNEAMKPSN